VELLLICKILEEACAFRQVFPMRVYLQQQIDFIRAENKKGLTSSTNFCFFENFFSGQGGEVKEKEWGRRRLSNQARQKHTLSSVCAACKTII
jgi:hypothetical protein